MKITPLKMWVQNVLPVIYDDSLSYYEMVSKINEKTNEIINQVNENTDDIESLNYVIQELGDIDELKALLEEVETIVDDLYTSDTPVMDSTNGSAGVADHAARSDHSHPSDSSKADVSLGIDGALAGQYVKIKTVEAGVPTEFENGAPHEVPSGGTTGQALRKESNGDYDADWEDVHELPNGGTTGQALKKNSNTNYDVAWSDTHEIPSGGNSNDFLMKSSNNNFDTKWTSTPPQMGAIAHINVGNTANKTYSKDEYLVYNGALYKVIVTTIAINTTLNPGVNIDSTDVNVFSALANWVDVTIATATEYTVYGKYNSALKIAQLIFAGNNTQLPADTYNIQLPDNFKPLRNFTVPMRYPNDTMEVRSDGVFRITTAAATNWNQGYAFYITN